MIKQLTKYQIKSSSMKKTSLICRTDRCTKCKPKVPNISWFNNEGPVNNMNMEQREGKGRANASDIKGKI